MIMVKNKNNCVLVVSWISEGLWFLILIYQGALILKQPMILSNPALLLPIYVYTKRLVLETFTIIFKLNNLH